MELKVRFSQSRLFKFFSEVTFTYLIDPLWLFYEIFVQKIIGDKSQLLVPVSKKSEKIKAALTFNLFQILYSLVPKVEINTFWTKSNCRGAVDAMSELSSSDLEIKDNLGYTALHIAG